MADGIELWGGSVSVPVLPPGHLHAPPLVLYFTLWHPSFPISKMGIMIPPLFSITGWYEAGMESWRGPRAERELSSGNHPCSF